MTRESLIREILKYYPDASVDCLKEKSDRLLQSALAYQRKRAGYESSNASCFF